jgi:hypothetical protein
MTTLEPVTDTVTNTEYINQRRVTQFNVYQEKKYGSYLEVLQYFTIYCVILLILAILRKRMILSYGFVNLLTMILVVVGGAHLYLKIANINNRNNMNFDEFDWSFNPDNQSDPNTLDTNLHEESTKGGATCVEEACCDTKVTKWCESTGLCILIGSDCEDETTNAINGAADSTGGASHWDESKYDGCDFPSKTNCKNPAFPYYCPGDNTCHSSFDPTNCALDGVKCGTTELWCPYEGTCNLPTVSCVTTPCDESTQEIQAQCPAGQHKCPGSNHLQCVNTESECVADIPAVNCGLKTGNEHSSCVGTSGDHHLTVSGFISGIADSYSYFKKSLNNIPQKEEKTNIGSFSDSYSSYASV